MGGNFSFREMYRDFCFVLKYNVYLALRDFSIRRIYNRVVNSIFWNIRRGTTIIVHGNPHPGASYDQWVAWMEDNIGPAGTSWDWRYSMQITKIELKFIRETDISLYLLKWGCDVSN